MIELSDRQSGRDDVQAGGETTSGPLDTSSVFSVAFMSFMSPLMRLGYSRPLVDDDIYPMPLQERVGSVYRKLDSNWKDAAPAGDVSLFKSLVRSFWPQSIRGGFMLLIAHAVSLTVPFIITDFVRYLTTACHDTTHGFLDALALFVATGCTSLAMNNAFYHNVRAAGSCRDSIMALIYTKSLKISAASRQATSTGETVNLMSADAQRVYESLIYIHFLWVAPLSVLVVTIILIYSLGYAALAGLLAMSLLIPYQWGNTSLAARFRRSMLRNTDKRIMSTSEMFAGIRVIKQYAWENHVAEKIAQIREVVDLKNLQLVNTLGTAIVAVWPGIVSALIFITFVLQGEQLTTVIVFFVLSLLVAVRLPISMLQKSIQVVTDGWVSLRRINRFVCLPELDLRGRSIDTGAPGTIIVNNASFSWGGSSTFPILRSVSFQFPPKLLVAVIGSVASGKSSLLSAIIGELAVTKGSIDVSGTFAYISQQHWIQNKSVRENILFGKPFDSDRYTSVVHAAALMPDLSVLPSGDETEIGEQGINLSGGQKARIMFARACYADTDIVLLDDPFSAVDVATGNIMFQYGVKRLLSNSTRVITLNSHLHFLQEVDQIVLLLPSANDSSDTVVHTFHNYDEFCTAYPNFANEKGDRDQEPVSTPVMVASATKDVLVEEESVQTGTVEGHVYMTYLDHCMAGGGVWAAIFLVTIFSVSQILRIGSDFISAEWGQTYMPDQRFWIMLQSVVIAAALVLFIGRSFIFNSMTIRASRLLHDHILKRLLLAPIPTFFDVTPLGRIVNRFSKDMDQIDVLISDYLGQLMLYGFTLAFSIALACYATPWFSIPLVPILLIFYWVQRYYRQSGRQLKRIEGTSRSPIFSAFEETLTGNGLSTIRAHRKQDVFTKDAFSAIEKNSRALLSNQLAGRWLALRLDLISNLVIVGVAFIIAGLSCSVNVAVSVLGLVQTTQLTGLLQWTVRVSTEVENNMTAVERVMEYTNVPVESPSNTTFCPDDRWPESGEIVFNNVHARYRPELPLVLNGVDFSIRPMEKVGICGRTGSGKSSLLLCLLRIIEVDPCGGKIFVDNVPIDQVGRHALRSRISVIPQDAVLFSGNIRENLDPFNERVDSDVLHALEQVSLRSERSNVALDDPVSERGYNFSHGQRQLICIARALLRNSKIIICDEATAGIDSETDKLIQIAIKSLFKTRTVLTVAHRLETIADSDRILVIKEGRVQEFDTPINLINNTGGYLYNMIAGGGEGAIRRFRSLTTKVQKTEIRSVNRAS